MICVGGKMKKLMVIAVLLISLCSFNESSAGFDLKEFEKMLLSSEGIKEFRLGLVSTIKLIEAYIAEGKVIANQDRDSEIAQEFFREVKRVTSSLKQRDAILCLFPFLLSGYCDWCEVDDEMFIELHRLQKMVIANHYRALILFVNYEWEKIQGDLKELAENNRWAFKNFCSKFQDKHFVFDLVYRFVRDARTTKYHIWYGFLGVFDFWFEDSESLDKDKSSPIEKAFFELNKKYFKLWLDLENVWISLFLLPIDW